MHISEQVAAHLLADGWKRDLALDGSFFTKKIEGFAEAGQFSDGTRLVTLSMDEAGRWLERHDGWGKVDKCVDLRDWADNPKGAIAVALDTSL